MKFWFKASLLSLAASGFMACSHHGAENSASKDYPAEETSVVEDKSCSELSQMICTREYLPTRCVIAKEEFSSSNPCEARRLVKVYACQKKIAYVEGDVTCESKGLVNVDKPVDECQAEAARKPCTREFKPHVCRLGEVVAKGNNHCEAVNALRTTVCSKKIAFAESEAICEAASLNENALPKAKRSR